MRVSISAALLFSLLMCAAGAGGMYVYLSREYDLNRPARRDVAVADNDDRDSLKTAPLVSDRATSQPDSKADKPTLPHAAQPTTDKPDVSAKSGGGPTPDPAGASGTQPPVPDAKTPDEILREAAKREAEAAKKEVENISELGLEELMAKRVDFSIEVSGTVADSRGNPVAGADVFADINERLGSEGGAMMVTFNEMGERIATTDSGGNFSGTIKSKVGEKSQVSLILRATAKGYAESKRLTLDAKNGESKTGLRLVLQGAGGVRGRVVDQHGSGIAGVTVSLSAQRGAGATYGEEVVVWGGKTKNAGVTDASGCYEVSDVAEGSYSLNLRAPGWREKSGPRVVEVKPDFVTPIETDFVLVPTTCLRAKLCGADGKPLSGWVTVELTPATGGSTQRLNAMVAEDGALAVNDPPVGDFNVVVKLWGYLDSASQFAALVQNQPTDLGTLALAPNPDAGKTTKRVRIGRTEK